MCPLQPMCPGLAHCCRCKPYCKHTLGFSVLESKLMLECIKIHLYYLSHFFFSEYLPLSPQTFNVLAEPRLVHLQTRYQELEGIYKK